MKKNFSLVIIIVFIVFNISCNKKKATNIKNKNNTQNIKKIKNMPDSTKILFKAKPIITEIDSFNILVELINIDIDSLFIETTFTVGYDDDEFTNIYYKILKLSDIGIYERIDEKTADYQYFYQPYKKELLPKGKSVKKNIYGIFTLLEKGNKYKIKFFYRMSKYSNYKDINTDWIEFEVR